MKIYTGEELLGGEFTEPPKLIDKFLAKEQKVILLGDAKIGKSILSQQIAFAVTAGGKFLDEFDVLEKSDVLYVQAEGDMNETMSRCKMMAKEMPMDKGRLRWMYTSMLPMDRDDSVSNFIKHVKETAGTFAPKLIIIDPLYMMASTGSLSDDSVAIKIVTSLQVIKDHFGATILVNHHEHRPRRDEMGRAIHEGDGSIFGSFVWRANMDHVIRISKAGEQIRDINCDTQRSGKIIKNFKLELCQPDPLYFDIYVERATDREKEILRGLRRGEKKEKELEEDCEMPRSTAFRILRRLRNKKLVEHDPNSGAYSITNEGRKQIG